MNFKEIHQKANKSPRKRKKVSVATFVVDRSPGEICAAYAGAKSDRKHIIRLYKQKFGVWPKQAFFIRGKNWWYLPVPEELSVAMRTGWEVPNPID